jgi:uncharacterized SAM-binding protein YcdF (DUF218 family)|tara:strand:- start:523893 stop:524492 length:600 start_codon:yes stop_codon:yes gene_type:complete
MKKTRKHKLALFILIAQLGIVVWLFGLMGFITYSYFQKPPALESLQRQAVIILTGDNGRIDTGLALADAINSPAILISGVDPRVTKDALSSNWNVGEHINIISLDHDALNTVDNAKQSAKWLKENQYTSAVLVTSSYHMLRAHSIMKAVMPEIKTIPYPVKTTHLPPQKLKFWHIMYREFNKTILVEACLIQRFINCLD